MEDFISWLRERFVSRRGVAIERTSRRASRREIAQNPGFGAILRLLTRALAWAATLAHADLDGHRAVLLCLLRARRDPPARCCRSAASRRQRSASTWPPTVIGPWLNRLQAFDVFSSFWFTAIYVLLFVSLVGCLTRGWSSTPAACAPPRCPPRAT